MEYPAFLGVDVGDPRGIPSIFGFATRSTQQYSACGILGNYCQHYWILQQALQFFLVLLLFVTCAVAPL